MEAAKKTKTLASPISFTRIKLPTNFNYASTHSAQTILQQNQVLFLILHAAKTKTTFMLTLESRFFLFGNVESSSMYQNLASSLNKRPEQGTVKSAVGTLNMFYNATHYNYDVADCCSYCSVTPWCHLIFIHCSLVIT